MINQTINLYRTFLCKLFSNFLFNFKISLNRKTLFVLFIRIRFNSEKILLTLKVRIKTICDHAV